MYKQLMTLINFILLFFIVVFSIDAIRCLKRNGYLCDITLGWIMMPFLGVSMIIFILDLLFFLTAKRAYREVVMSVFAFIIAAGFGIFLWLIDYIFKVDILKSGGYVLTLLSLGTTLAYILRQNV